MAASMGVQACRVQSLPRPLRGATTVPGDKSISHRVVLLAAMAEGVSCVSGILDSLDVRASIEAVRMLGAKVSLETQPDGSLAGEIAGWGSSGPFPQVDCAIDCGNSGTTARLLMGILASWDVRVELTGDRSLRRRPMGRIAAPLAQMGARFEPHGCETLPFFVCGTSKLRSISYDAPVASAQLKTAVLLAATRAHGTTTLTEPFASRNHTELMLPEFGVEVAVGDRSVSVTGPLQLRACEVRVPGDPSSAAFLVCAAALVPGSCIRVENVGLNAARIGFVRVLERMGAKVEVSCASVWGAEPCGSVSVCYTPDLRACEVSADEIASVVDEIPALALVAARACGVTVFRQVGELRVKESDRLSATVSGLGALGIRAWIDGDDLFVEGQSESFVRAEVRLDSKGDHRLAMTWALAGMCNFASVEVVGLESVNISYPRFINDIERLAQ